jgi:phage shock protein E
MDKVLQLSSEELKKLIDNNSNFLLLDVRSPEEYERGRIKGSVNIPYELVGEKLSLLVPDKKTKIVVYCLSGSRSMGFDRGFANLEGERLPHRIISNLLNFLLICCTIGPL